MVVVQRLLSGVKPTVPWIISPASSAKQLARQRSSQSYPTTIHLSLTRLLLSYCGFKKKTIARTELPLHMESSKGTKK